MTKLTPPRRTASRLQGHRPVVAMGYSGGFVPMIEGMLQTPFSEDVTGIIGLGAATFNITKDMADLIVNLVKKITDGVIEGVEELLSKLTPVGNVISEILGFIRANTIDLALDKLRDIVSVFRLNPISVLPNLAVETNAEFVLNVWGSEDVLSEWAVGSGRLSRRIGRIYCRW